MNNHVPPKTAKTSLPVGLALLLSNLAAQQLILVEQGADPCPIFAEKADTAAAQALAKYLKQISGAEFAVTATEAPPAGKGILVGSFGSQESQELPGDSFIIRTIADGQDVKLQIAGATPRGTHFGVYAFLEEVLGCRWWSHNEEEVPSSPTIRVGAVNIARKAVFRQADLLNREAQSGTNGFVYKSRGKSTEAFTGGHTLYPLLTPYAKEHPEIYPYSKKTGKRAANNLHFCYSAPGIAEALADALEKQVQRRKGNVSDFIYMAGMGDWYGGFCQCERCEKIYAEEVWTRPDGEKRDAPSSTLIRMINRTAEILEGKYPGVRVGTFAYMSLEGPPGKTVPRGNVVIWQPHLRHCIIHGVDQCEKNRNYYYNLKRWCELAPGRVYIWDYGVSFKNFLYPFPVLRSMAENIRLYARMGVAGVMVQGNYVSTGSDLVVLKNYLWRKLLWNPGLETKALLEEFCKGYYGPASRPIVKYVNELENAVARQSDAHMDEFANRETIRKTYLTDKRAVNLRRRLAKAAKKAGGEEPYCRRIREAGASLEAFTLWCAGPLVERGGRLVRADLDHQYTYPRALDLVKHCRGASPREWGTGRSYHLSLLPLHGGPLARLSKGEVEVEVAPVLGCVCGRFSTRERRSSGSRSPTREAIPCSAGPASRSPWDTAPAR